MAHLIVFFATQQTVSQRLRNLKFLQAFGNPPFTGISKLSYAFLRLERFQAVLGRNITIQTGSTKTLCLLSNLKARLGCSAAQLDRRGIALVDQSTILSNNRESAHLIYECDRSFSVRLEDSLVALDRRSGSTETQSIEPEQHIVPEYDR